MYIFLIVLIIIASILLVLAVLAQNPKGGMAANFGASNQVMGVRQTADFLERSTWALAIAIVVLSLLASIAMSSHRRNTLGARRQSARADNYRKGNRPSQHGCSRSARNGTARR